LTTGLAFYPTHTRGHESNCAIEGDEFVGLDRGHLLLGALHVYFDFFLLADLIYLNIDRESGAVPAFLIVGIFSQNVEQTWDRL
jgi:hypothetical protein